MDLMFVSKMLFRLQKYKKFESNSQQASSTWCQSSCCFDCKSTKNLRAIHNTISSLTRLKPLFRLQKYKKFESNSQPKFNRAQFIDSCFDCKSTKNLRAIHNSPNWRTLQTFVVSTAKVQKIWEQFTTGLTSLNQDRSLFRLQKYKKFESNSQRRYSCAKRR